MNARHACLILLFAVIAAACNGSESREPEAASTAVTAPAPEVTVDDSTTIVRNSDVPFWPRTMALGEEASIGASSGDEAYLLGGVHSIGAGNGRIYIADSQTVKVRVYDLDGRHLFDIGGQGNGPGEFRRPWAIALTDDDRLVVRDQLQRRVHVFTADGELIDDWPSERGRRTTIGADGSAYVMRENVFPDADGRITVTAKEYGPDGGEHDWVAFPDRPPTPTIESVGNQLELMAVFLGVDADWESTRWIPFAPRVINEIAPDGAMVSGRGDAYLFEVQRGDASVLAVEKEWSVVPVEPDEADWHRRRLTAQWRAATDESWAWLGADIPTVKGAFHTVIPTFDGSFWVIRETAGIPIAPCNENPDDYYGFVEAPCWTRSYVADVFDETGRFLGTVEMPGGVQYHVRPYIRDDTIIALSEDADGVAYVKRFRLAATG